MGGPAPPPSTIIIPKVSPVRLQDMRYLLDPVQFTPKREYCLWTRIRSTQLRSRSIDTPTQLRSTSPCFRSTLVDSNQIDAVSDRRLFACSTSPCFRSSFPAPCFRSSFPAP
ncbi:hypothetical protein LXL04_027248 [Taraxacum kok-saghyz]